MFLQIYKRLIVASALLIFSNCPALAQIAPEDERYFVVGSYIAEIVVELGAADQFVGVSAGTDHIEELAGVPVIPGYRNLSAESILALQPTVALLGGAQSQPELISQLSAAGIEVHVFESRLADIEVVAERIREVGDILGKQTEAETLVEHFQADLEAALSYAAQATSHPRGLFILSGGGRPTVVAGADTHIALIINYAGGVNMTDGITNFQPMSQEAMLAAQPDFILVNEDGLTLSGGTPVALTAPGAQLTPAAQNGQVFTLPGSYLQGLGLHTPEAIRTLAQRIHPELPAPE